MIGVRAAGFTIIAVVASALPVNAQSASVPEPVQVLILGTFHFANPGLDIVKNEVADVLTPTKQDEIQRVVAALARFKPTKIAVEDSPGSAPRIDSLYTAYRAGRHELTRNETQQLGFRLAAQLGHSRLNPIDQREDFPFEAMMEYAQAHDTAFVVFVEQELVRMSEESNRRHKEHTIGEILRMGNDPKALAADHGTYMRFAGLGAGDSYIGADLVTKWYERNLKIFANLQRLAEPGDRILVIFGTGHAPTLREFVSYHPDMVLVDPLGYLPDR